MEAEGVAAMLAEDRREWALLRKALEAQPEGALHDPESPEWTARDVFTHLAAMMEGSTQLIDEYLRDMPPRRIYEGRDEDDVNARLRKQHDGMSFDDARAWAQRAFEALVAKIESIPLDRWDSRFEFYARADGARHIRAHRSWIRE